MNITYKKATPLDIEVLNNLATQIWHEHYPSIISLEQINYMLDLMYSPQALQQQMEAGHQFTLAFVDEVLVGYISVNEETEGNFLLNKFYIQSQYRNLKLGEKLLKHIEDELFDRLKTMRLYVNRLNYKSINFYFKVGFKIEAVVDKDIGNGFFMNDFVMIKKY